MFCKQCGSQLGAGARFCSSCGTPVGVEKMGDAGQPWPNQYPGAQYGAAIPGDPLTRLQRPRTNRVIAGVCAGLAQHYHWDLTWVRVLTVLVTIFSSGAGLIAYIVFWLVMPEQPWMLPMPGQSGASVPPSGL